MNDKIKSPLFYTIKERCRMCYSCVRECPAKAIRISGGQAEVIIERCIGCGNCVRVCTQKAKGVRNSISDVNRLIKSEKKTAAILAPSFPAEFNETHYRKVVGMIRALGFDTVHEVAFGADLVSDRYRELMKNINGKQYIATTCPAIVSYIEKYHPTLIPNLSPIASPMIAAARALKKIYGPDTPIVFIGPCPAKKDEAERDGLDQDIDEVLTFRELHDMFRSAGINQDNVLESEFDPPHSGPGAIYPIGKGMLEASGMNESFLSMDIVATDGTKQFVQAINEFENENHSVSLLEVLCCNGCIMGSGMTSTRSMFSKRGYVSVFASKRSREINKTEHEKIIRSFDDLDLSVNFRERDKRLPTPTREELRDILETIGKTNPEDELNCGACGYDTCLEHAIAIHKGLAEQEMCLPYTIEKLRKTAEELAQSYDQLLNTKQALIQSEKLASMGRMASGIAHEINNPLTGVLTYSSLLLEDLGKSEYENDLKVIVDETIRCREIVKGLLDFARQTRLEKVRINMNKVIIDTMSILTKHLTFQNVKVELDLDVKIPETAIDINQIKSVINNLAENAAQAMPCGGMLKIKSWYEPECKSIKISFSDSGSGISEENISKIFDPFFTTKPAGKGTGLGLAVIYGIIERHFGTIDVESTPGEGTTFTINLPDK